jgi:hypothetical protein
MTGFSCHGGRVLELYRGVSMPSALWRLVRLRKLSRYSKIALASSTRVFQRWRSNSSACIGDQNASIMELSQQSPTLPMEGTRSESLAAG